MSKVFAAGDINLDILFSKQLIEFGKENELKSLDFSLGGNAANFSFALSSLGKKCVLVAGIGKDFTAGFLKQELGRAGVKTELIESGKKSGISLIKVAVGGERAILSNKNAAAELTVKEVEKRLRKAKKGDLAYFGGFFHLPKLRKGFNGLLKKLKKKKVFTAFDLTFDKTGKWQMPSYKLIDLLFLNEVELQQLTKTKNEKKAVAKLFAAGAKQIVLKKGKKGAAYYSPQKTIHLKAKKIKAVDATAAGDVFNAGFVYGRLCGLTDSSCLKLASFVAETKIRKHGMVLPSRKELNKFLKQI